MEASKRRAFIKQQTSLKKKQESQPPAGTGTSNPFAKRKSQEKSDHQPKKLKTIPEPVVGLKAEAKKTVSSLGHRREKGLMTGQAPSTEKPPVLTLVQIPQLFSPPMLRLGRPWMAREFAVRRMP
ncbi:hypothetical protein SO802_009624 [Lithocarpus litseifolius]|uniref:Uncharacterized protein n=1 Tax=Lithocarpus litseifolius TaxID=425828 RepID=A0AAW2DBY0_9ROSI